VELNPYDINYELRAVMKRQVLADFLAEFTHGALTHINALEG